MKGKRGKVLAIIVCLAMVSTVFLTIPVGAISGKKVDLNLWTAETYGASPGDWSVSNNNKNATQWINTGEPTMFYGDFSAYSAQVEGTIVVETGAGDNDYIGFAIGFNPGDSINTSADYLLIDWKQENQYYNFPGGGSGGTAYEGLAVSHVTNIPTPDNFWQHNGYVTEITRANTLGSTGWIHGQEYVFRIAFTPTSLKVYVDGVLEFDITGSFEDGSFAFYNFTQRYVTYSNFTVQAITEAIPPGWDKGNKTGWDNLTPPGLDNNDKTPPGFDEGNKTGWD